MASDVDNLDDDIVSQICGGGVESDSECELITVLAFHYSGLVEEFGAAQKTISNEWEERWTTKPTRHLPFVPCRLLPRNVVLQERVRLVEGKVETLESEFGFDSLRLAALTTAPLGNQQETLMEETQGQAEALLLATLGNRLGFERLQRHIPQPTHLPDREVAAQPVLSQSRIQDLPVPLSPRPILRFPMPEPIEALDETETAPPGPPRQFRWRRKIRTTLTITGPERVCPPWWRTEPDWHSTRDYWCVQTDEGPRLWLYQSAKPARWFVAGELS